MLSPTRRPVTTSPDQVEEHVLESGSAPLGVAAPSSADTGPGRDQAAPVHDHHVGAGLLDLGQQVAGDDHGTAVARRSARAPRASRRSAAGRARWWARRAPAGRAGRAWPGRWPAAAACPGSRCVRPGRAPRRARRSPAPRRSGRPRRAGRSPASRARGCPGRTGAAGSRAPRRTSPSRDSTGAPGVTRWPKMRISPASGWISPISMRSVVVLPAPLGPSRPSTWPRSTRNDRSSTASSPLPYALVRPVIRSGTSAVRGRRRGRRGGGGARRAAGRPRPRRRPAAAPTSTTPARSWVRPARRTVGTVERGGGQADR